MRCCVTSRTVCIVIGVMTAVGSVVMEMVTIAMLITLQEHVDGCMLQGGALCGHVADIDYILASRVFVMVQAALWFLLLLFSGLLIFGVVKERPMLFVPWIVLLLVVMGSIVYDAVLATRAGNMTSLAISLSFLAVASCCLAQLFYHARQIARRRTFSSTLINFEDVFSPTDCHYVNRQANSSSHVHNDRNSVLHPFRINGTPKDQPPAYDKVVGKSKHENMPSNLGFSL